MRITEGINSNFATVGLSPRNNKNSFSGKIGTKLSLVSVGTEDELARFSKIPLAEAPISLQFKFIAESFLMATSS